MLRYFEQGGGFMWPILIILCLGIAIVIVKGITLTGIDLSSTGSVSLRADVAPDIAANPAQQQPGSCAG